MKPLAIASLAAVCLAAAGCSTRETRIIQAPAVVSATPGNATTIVRSSEAAAPVVIETDRQPDIVVKVD